jgi:hypothetical protein
MGPKAWLAAICVAAFVAGCGSSSDAGETGSASTVTLSDGQREQRIMEYLRMPQFDREVTDLIKLVSVETDRAKVVFEVPDNRAIPYEDYCDAVLDSGYVVHAEIYTETDYSNSGAPSAECDE